MAPTKIDINWQTDQVIKCLLEDKDDVSCRKLDACLEHDGPGGPDDRFDPVFIADKLKSIADALNDDSNFKAALTELKQAAASEAVEAAFGHGVEALCQTQVAQKAEVAPEMQLIRASVTFGLYVKKSCPELKSKVHEAMSLFLKRRVGKWIAQQGGWDKVTAV